MDWLEVTKKELHDNEAITNDVAAQAHLENWALKLFLYADKNDRAANFSNNVVQSFYTAQALYNVLTLFGELSVEAAQNRKYAQWKASYIHNCLMNGETPVPGPMKEQNEDNDFEEALDNDAPAESPKDNIPQSIPSIPASPPTTRTESLDTEDNTEYKTDNGVKLSVEQVSKAQKFIKWASSALDYDDISTSVMNLRKAIHLLTTGQEPA